jgi:hypothetical protein
MKKHSGIILLILFAFFASAVFAQDSDSWGASDDFFEGDIDSLFDDIPEETEETSPPNTEIIPPPPSSTSTVLESAIRKTGFTLDASFNFAAGYSPGWELAPWHWETEKDERLDNLLLAKMGSTLSLDIQVSDALRAKQSFTFDIPSLQLKISEFFFDYNVSDTVFFRAGKYAFNWGISPNFAYTNLPARIPNSGDFSGDLYLVRADIPIGIGGFQTAVMARSSVLGNGKIDSEDAADTEDPVNSIANMFFFGLKYNVAIPLVDVDVGFLYNRKLNTRAFLSLKTTLFDQLELYSEGLLSYNLDTKSDFAASGNIGFIQEFFDSRLTVNAELFYNGEKDAFYVQDESFLTTADTVAFMQGFNTALNIRYKPSWLPKTELLLQYLHGFSENTVQLVPGFRITPLSNMNLYVAVPMALGSKEGTYYKDNIDEKNRPFSIVVMLTFSGSYRYSNK